MTFQGEDITRLPAHGIVARGLGHVPEGRMIFSNLTVDENLSMGAYLVRDKAAVAGNRDYVFGIFPAPQGARPADGGHALGGRAADAGDRPRPHG